MIEIELKYQVPPERRAAVAAFVAGKTPTPRIRLQAAYFDTADRALARAGMALRLRREGRRWVQTLKGLGEDGMTRAEHNVPWPDGPPDGPDGPVVDVSRHAEVPVGERLLAVLAASGQPLACTYRTDIWRQPRLLRTPLGQVELAFDEGRLIAGSSQLAVCELEIELLSGSPLAVLDVARRWALRFGLWMDTRSKAERGDMLSRAASMAPAVLARPVPLAAGMDTIQAARVVLLSCLHQVSTNASQVGSGDYGDEHVHQLRVGLRRLRSALRFLDGLGQPPLQLGMLGEPVAEVFRRLGAARDSAVMGGQLAEDLMQALVGIGADAQLPALPADASGEDPVQVVRDPATQLALLHVMAWTQLAHTRPDSLPGAAPVETDNNLAAEASDPLPLASQLALRLQRWHRQVVRDLRRFAELDDEARHQLRKRVKRERYAIEFARSLFADKAVKQTLKPLRELQEHLGELNDVATALAAFSPLTPSDPHAWFVLGWLAARRERLLVEAEPALKALVKAPCFWAKAARKQAGKKAGKPRPAGKH